MLYCNNCGQCHYINDDNFGESRTIRGSQTTWVDNIEGEIQEYGDDDIDDSEHNYYFCPSCEGDDIDDDWDGDEAEALETRQNYDTRTLQRARDRELQRVEEAHKEAVQKTGWDV